MDNTPKRKNDAPAVQSIMSIRDIFRKKIDESRAAELDDIMIRADVAPNIATEIAGKLRQSDDPKKSLEESLLYYAKKLERPPISCLVSRFFLRKSSIDRIRGSARSVGAGFKSNGNSIAAGAAASPCLGGIAPLGRN